MREAYAKERLATPLDKQVRQAIRATHLACMTMELTVLIDTYKVDDVKFLRDYLDLQKELLVQYGDGKVELKQMTEHIKLKTGIDIEKFTDSVMEFSKIDRKEFGENERETDYTGMGR